MKCNKIECYKCGADALSASDRGAYLARVNPTGVIPMIVQCAPSCYSSGDKYDALIRAINGNANAQV